MTDSSLSTTDQLASEAAPAGSQPASTETPDLVFIGGTGRAGTHIISKLLGRHSHYRKIGNEVRFHCNPKGYPDLLAGRVTKDEFLAKLTNFWWYRERRAVRGLHRVVPRERFDAAVERFDAAYDDDPVAACRGLFFDFFEPLAVEDGKPGLVEMSCFTVAQGPTLLRVFPEAKLIHTVRDGRDAGSSKVSKRHKKHHPTDQFSGLTWWDERLRNIDGAVRETPPEKLLVISMDELVHGDREASYGQLLEFLHIDDEPEMREFFDTKMDADAAHRERWREGLSEDEQAELERRYEQTLEGLEADGVHCAPLLRRVYEHES
jgi:hypothetical protein